MKLKKPSKNIIKIGLLIFVLILVAFFIINYRNISTLRNWITELNNIFQNTTIVFLFYLLIIITFKDSLNIKNITLKVFGRVSLMILSAYFSYLAFKKLDVPEFFAVTGGMGFVIGVLEAKKNLKKTAKLKKNYKVGGNYLFYIFATVMAVVLDISMTASNLVLGEGKTAIKQETFYNYSVIETARTKKSQVDYLQGLINNGKNYENARFHSNNFLKADSLAALNKVHTDSTTYFAGPLERGFASLLNSKRWGKIITSFFILIISCAITILMVAFEDDDDFDIRGYVLKNIDTDNMKIGFDVERLKAKAENENIDNENQNENYRRLKENFSSNFHKIRKLGNEKRKQNSESVKENIKEAIKLGYTTNAQIAKFKGVNRTPQRVGQIRKELGI